jgi:hypothetical protein
MEDGIDDPVQVGDVAKADYRARAPTDIQQAMEYAAWPARQ